MTNHQEKIQAILRRSALIILRYNLGDKEFFFKIYSDLNCSDLEVHWSFAMKRFKNEEIIKDTTAILLSDEISEVNNIVISHSNDSDDQLYYFLLYNKFAPKDYKFKDEKIVRRAYKILASEYLNKLLTQFTVLKNYQPSSLELFLNYFAKYRYIAVIFTLVILSFIPRIIKGLTHPEVLLQSYLHDKYSKIEDSIINAENLGNFLYEDGVIQYRVGAICKDGWRSPSKGGSGTCSHHGGVLKYIYEKKYSKSNVECIQIAEGIINQMMLKAYRDSWLY